MRIALLAEFWDQNGNRRRGEVVTPHRVRGSQVVAHFATGRENELAVMTVKDGEFQMHEVLVTDVRKFKTVVTV
jgi:hypothetical protein